MYNSTKYPQHTLCSGICMRLYAIFNNFSWKQTFWKFAQDKGIVVGCIWEDTLHLLVFQVILG